MGKIKDYKISGNDLFLTEELFWTFKPDRQNAIQIWHLTNVKESYLDINILNELKNYSDSVDIEEAEIKDKSFLFKISCELDNKNYIFECDRIDATQRPYNEIELTEIILRLEKTWQENTKTIYKQRQFIKNLKSFVSKQIETKSRIIVQLYNPDNLAHKKAKIQLEVLQQIDNFLNNDNNY